MEDRTAPHVGERYVTGGIAWRTALGPVWNARDQVLGRPVYIQTVESGDHAGRQRFRATAAALARVTDPGVAQVYDIGSDPPFAVFEHLSGGRLSDLLRRGPVAVPEATRIALGLARALEALHAEGLHHGALRPEVVLLDQEGRAKLLVLDVAGELEQPASYRTSQGTDAVAADTYALAALTWHMVSGRIPQHPLPRRGGRELDAILRRALDPDPARRLSMERFIGALAPFARVAPSKAKRTGGRAAEFRWLVPAAIIATLAILAATLGVDLARDLAKRTNTEATASPTKRATRTALSIAEVADYDPLGDRRENGQLADLTTDGSAATTWRTERYTRAGLGGKSGVGLRFDLGEVQTVGSVQILSPTGGWSGEVHLSSEEPRRLSTQTRAAVFTGSTTTNVRIPAPVVARYVYVWITQLIEAEDGGDPPYLVELSEVRIFAP